MRLTISLIASILLSISSAVLAKPNADDGFMTYWAKFRAAALRNDTTTLALLTQFPLEAGSDYAPDHPGHISRAQFPALFRTEMRCPALDKGSQLDMIRQRVVLNPKYDYHVDGRATVGSFEFRKIEGQWRLTTIEYGGFDYRTRLKGRCE